MTFAKSCIDSGLRDYSVPKNNKMTGVKEQIQLSSQQYLATWMCKRTSVAFFEVLARLEILYPPYLSWPFKITECDSKSSQSLTHAAETMTCICWSYFCDLVSRLEYGVISSIVESDNLLRPTEKDQRCIRRYEGDTFFILLSHSHIKKFGLPVTFTEQTWQEN